MVTMPVRKTGLRRSRGLGLASVVLLSLAGQAFAEPSRLPEWSPLDKGSNRTLPEIFTSVASMPPAEPEPEPGPASLSLPEPRSIEARSITRWHKPKQSRHRMKVVDYRRSMVVGNEDVIVKLVSPGKRRSIMSLEIKF